MPKAIPQIQVSERDIGQIQAYILGFLNVLAKKSILDGVILSKVALATGSNTIQHKLGRTLIGWFLIRNRANATVYDTQDSNTSPTSTLQLTASAATTVDLYVF